MEPSAAATSIDAHIVSPLPASATRPAIFHLFLGRWAFAVCWWFVFCFHVFLGGFAFSVTALHRYLQDEKVATSVDALHVPKESLQMTARVFFLVGLAHFIAIFRLLRNSCRARKLILHATSKPTNSEPATPPLAVLRPLYCIFDAVTGAWGALFGPTGFFGFSGPYFETVFMCREAWEILMQTYQAYKLSQSVPRKWINQLAVAAIVLSCVSSPLVHVMCRKNETLRRVLSLLQDAILDFCCSVVVPLSVILPYVHTYNTHEKGFAMELLMNDVWFVNAISEMRQVLVTSFPDFVSTIMPQVSLLGYLMTFKNILRRSSACVQDEPAQLSRVQPDVETTRKGPVLRSQSRFGTGSIRMAKRLRRKSIHLARSLHREPGNLKHWLGIAVHVLFLVWGCAVLAFHLDAIHNTDRHIPGCQLHVSAWHSLGFPCSVMLLNCHMSQVDGSTNQTTAVLDLLERASLQVLIFSHCRGLQVPPVVTEFKNLAGFEFFNSTLADWPREAAVREATQPRVSYVYFVMTNWTSFPPGLLHGELPVQLTHLSVIVNNLTELPDNIDVWRTQQWISLIFDRVPLLRELPPSFCSLRVTALWLTSTGFTSFPKACMEQVGMIDLALSGSKSFENLPDLVGANLRSLLLEHTNLSRLPAWFDEWSRHEQEHFPYLYGSPACFSNELRDNTALWQTACGADLGTSSGLYPWEIMLPLRPFELT